MVGCSWPCLSHTSTIQVHEDMHFSSPKEEQNKLCKTFFGPAFSVIIKFAESNSLPQNIKQSAPDHMYRPVTLFLYNTYPFLLNHILRRRDPRTISVFCVSICSSHLAVERIVKFTKNICVTVSRISHLCTRFFCEQL